MELEFTIEDFSGPLDLLLHLIKKEKMNILDIEIEKITEQYINYINKMQEMNLEVTSNYLVLASELLYIKSKMLLPRSNDEEDVEEDDPRQDLVDRLVEYQSYKEITDLLKEKSNIRSEVYTKAPEEVKNYVEDNAIINSDVSLDDLVLAFQKFLQRKEEVKPLKTKVTEKEIKVSDRKIKIKGFLKSKKHFKFTELFEDFSKEYVVATFLAVLELAKEGELRIVQDKDFGEIECEAIR